jgi:hypothetical protein
VHATQQHASLTEDVRPVLRLQSGGCVPPPPTSSDEEKKPIKSHLRTKP